jgi:hypothetical protein
VAARTGRLRAPAFMISPIKNTRSKIGSGAPTSSGGSPSTLWPSACTTPDVQPFTTAWTDVPPDERARSTMHYHWSRWASWTPSDWTLEFAVISDGEVAGTQGIGGRDSAVLREVHTGSWLGRRYQGRGSEPRCAPRCCTWPSKGSAHRTPPPVPSSTTPPRSASHANSVLQRLRLTRADWQAARVQFSVSDELLNLSLASRPPAHRRAPAAGHSSPVSFPSGTKTTTNGPDWICRTRASAACCHASPVRITGLTGIPRRCCARSAAS